MSVSKKIIIFLIEKEVGTSSGLAAVKRKMAKEHKVPCPSNIALLKTYHEMVKNKRIKPSNPTEDLLRTRPIRSLSGIVNVSVLTKPYPCPGKCLYCPTEKGIPKSYVSGEPAVERAKKLKFNPYLQVKKRIETLELEGHSTDKIELRIIGGTWSYYPKKYQNWFVMRCFQGANEFNKKSKLQTEFLKETRTKKKMKLSSSAKAQNLKNAQRENEKAKHRIVGLSIETRPDFINLKEIKRLRELGATMIELGVQSIYDDVLKLNLRGHEIKETILATKLLKDAGFKVLYQMMLNLFGSDIKRDKKTFKKVLFKNSDFQPDLLKIYPCALLKEAPLYELWKNKKYNPYAEKELINLIGFIKKNIPYYVRIQRIIRDIPSKTIIFGPAKISNLRQILMERMKKEDWQCKCIRCREVKEKYDPKEKIFLFRMKYNASEGKEIFLSFENKNKTKLFSLLRLRITSQNKAIIREIHTYGRLQPIGRGSISTNSPQHKGLGKKLIKEAEKIVKKEFDLNKIAVISGVGVRNYWRKLNYKLRKTYMVKKI